MPFLQKLKRPMSRPQAVQASDWYHRSIMDRDLRMKALLLGKCRVERPGGFDHLPLREDLDVVRAGAQQGGYQLDLDRIGHAAVADDRAPLQQRGPLIRRDVRDSHGVATPSEPDDPRLFTRRPVDHACGYSI